MKTSRVSVILSVAICLGALFVAPGSVRADTWTVTSTADSGPGTLRQALASAADGDTIVFLVPMPAVCFTSRAVSLLAFQG